MGPPPQNYWPELSIPYYQATSAVQASVQKELKTNNRGPAIGVKVTKPKRRQLLMSTTCSGFHHKMITIVRKKIELDN